MSDLGPKKKTYKNILLMYSGGLDTSTILKWLQENYNAEVYTFTADLGQEFADPTRFKEIEEKAKKLGAKKHFTVDLKDIFFEEYIVPTIKANGLYQGIYPLSTAVGRPLIAIEAVKIAKKENIEALAHGCTGKGNDQIRINTTANAYAPEIEVLQPLIEWNMGRDEEIKYAEQHGIQIQNQNKKYSTDENLFGRSAECDILEHPEIEPPEDSKAWTVAPEKAPDTAEYITINFEEGIPVGLNGEMMNGVELIRQLHEIGCKHGIGRIEHMEDRAIGLKSRETYEVPAAQILIKAHRDLEKYVCTKHENSFKQLVDHRWTELAYEGLWVDPLREALEAFINEINIKVTGSVKVKLFKGSANVVARESPYGIYDLNLATYDTDSSFNQKLSYGFIPLWGLQSRMGFITKRKLEQEKKK
ncbi:MAG: argininosuccinate synthase [Candidatus Lokiarchaeota archaeon]|nr:argininosuccinate synthase [Candidatus Lokiarchaeota archaeon]